MLLIYGFVLKPYVLDLVPGNSLVGEGFDVYMLAFGISGVEDAGTREGLWETVGGCTGRPSLFVGLLMEARA